MYQVSEEYKEAMKASVQRFSLFGDVGGVPFEEKDILAGSFGITNQCSDNTRVQIGTVYVGELDATFIGLEIPRYSWKGREISPFFGRYTDDPLNPEQIPLGVFSVAEAQWTAAGVVVKAYDNMSKLDKACTVTSVSGLPFQLATMACTSCGVQLGTTAAEFSLFANGSEQMAMFTENDIETWRDFISWLSQALACFVYAGRDGKIYFRPYDQNVVDEISDTHRFVGAEFSDFETRYTGLSCVNIAQKTTTYYGMEEDDGLTYNLGSNPFLQYGVGASQDAMRTSVLRAIQAIKYVPFKVSLIGDPAYDLGDVFRFPDGIGDGDVLYCMTKYSWTYNGDYTMEGVGENPALMNAKSKTDKNLEGLLASQDDNGMKYTQFTNVNEIDVGDGEHRQVMNIRFVCQKQTHVAIEMQFNLIAMTTEEGSYEEGYVNDDAVGTFTYYVDGSEIEMIHPKHTWQDGEYTFRLRYDLSGVESSIHNWEVWLNMHGGAIHVDPYYLNVTIMGQGVVADDFNGIVQASDVVPRHDFRNIRKAFTELVDVAVHTPVAKTISDALRRHKFTEIFRGISDSVFSSGDVMVFRPVTNQDKVTHTATVEDGIWKGSGTIVGGDAAYVETIALTGIDHVIATSSNANFIVSADGGLTWVGHTENGWVQDAYMTRLEIEGVTSEQWAELGDSVAVRTYIEADASLSTLNCYGASMPSEINQGGL